MHLDRSTLLGSWRAVDQTCKDPIIYQFWYHFCPDNYLASEFFVEGYGWNVNWQYFEVAGSDQIKAWFLGTYQRKLMPDPKTYKLTFDNEVLIWNSCQLERSADRPIPDRYDILSGITNLPGKPIKKWVKRFSLVDPTNATNA